MVFFVLSVSVNLHAEVLDTYGYAHIDPRGAGIFALAVPGETYDPLSGKIGYKHNDLVASGNGPLSIVMQRNFEEIPQAYPYEFGNMSL